MSQAKITCSICLSECTKPRTLKCSHKFCEDCVLDYEKQFKNEECFPCPMCRADISVDGAKGESDSRPSLVKEYCHAHDDVVESICVDCERLVCHRCCLTTHKLHNVTTIDVIYPECMEVFLEVKKDLEAQVPKFDQFSQKVRVKISEIRKSGEDVCQDVDDRIQEVTRALVKVGEEMKSKIWKNCLDEENKMTHMLAQSTSGTQITLANLKYADYVQDKSLSEIDNFTSVMQINKRSNKRRNFNVPDFNIPHLLKGEYDDDYLTLLLGSIHVPKVKTGTQKVKPNIFLS